MKHRRKRSTVKRIKVLFIDDDRNAEAANPAVDVTVVRTTDEAVDQLLSGSWDEVWFDHDMGYTKSGGVITTRSLAEWVVENQDTLDIGQVIVHTASPDGGPWLKRVLGQLQGVPVFYLYDR